jgi:hypothetical protein
VSHQCKSINSSYYYFLLILVPIQRRQRSSGRWRHSESMVVVLLSHLAALLTVGSQPVFELYQSLDAPVIDSEIAHAQSGGGAPNSGFEGGLFFRDATGLYHLFPSECMLDQPHVAWDIHMESHDWTSPDGIHNWTRGSLLYNSSAKTDGSDRRAAIWAPMTVYDEGARRWNMFYVGYTCHPGQYDGAIYRLVSQTAGPGGVAGPYPAEEATIILDLEGAGGRPAHWEGTAKDQGTDSFYPWRLDNGSWVAFFGVHDKSGDTGGANSTRTWKVGLVMAESLAGPWRRLNSLNPAEYIETPEGIENPIVTRTTDKKYYVAVYDALMPDQIKGHEDVVGISVSTDGTHFGPAQYVHLNASASGCGSPVRTPQGLIPEPDKCKGCYSMMYTGHGGKPSYANECWVMLRNLAEA